MSTSKILNLSAPITQTASWPTNGNSQTPRTLSSSLFSEVQQVFAQVTRYPQEILEPDADLEEDLGIDSVKLGEIFSVLRERYQLPPLNQLELSGEQLRTISQLTLAIEGLVGGTTPPEAEPIDAINAVADIAPVASLLTTNGNEQTPITISSSLLNEVQQVFAQVTRYPQEILEPDADLEEDLGIDSVKLGEIFSVLRERYQLPPLNQLELSGEQLRTISQLTLAIEGLVGATAPSEAKPIDAINAIAAIAPVAPLPTTNGNGQVVSGTFVPSNAHNSVNPIPLTNSKFALSRPLDHKIALVTGSGRGLGKVIACHLAQLGATVIVNSFHSRELGEATADEIRASGGKAIHIWGSVANDVHLSLLFEQIESEFGKLDFLISNASNGLLAPLEEIKREHLDKAFHTNVIGLHQAVLQSAKLMKKQGGGKIITLSTNAAYRYIPYFGCMAAVKAAVEALTRYFAVELAPYNIQVNCVTSGPVYGELIDKWPDSDKLIPYWESISLGHSLCTPEDVADMVAYLLRDEVKRVNGSILLINAGQSIHL